MENDLIKAKRIDEDRQKLLKGEVLQRRSIRTIQEQSSQIPQDVRLIIKTQTDNNKTILYNIKLSQESKNDKLAKANIQRKNKIQKKLLHYGLVIGLVMVLIYMIQQRTFLQTLTKSSNYQPQQLQSEIHKGWTILMKIFDESNNGMLAYNSTLWTSRQTLNEFTARFANELVRFSAKYSSFNDLQLTKILIFLPDTGRYTILKMPEQQQKQSLLWYFQQDKPFYLEYEAGCKDIIELIKGVKDKDSGIVEPSWRINSNSQYFYMQKTYKYQLRIGGWKMDPRNEQYIKGNYLDKNGKQCTDSSAGFGISYCYKSINTKFAIIYGQ